MVGVTVILVGATALGIYVGTRGDDGDRALDVITSPTASASPTPGETDPEPTDGAEPSVSELASEAPLGSPQPSTAPSSAATAASRRPSAAATTAPTYPPPGLTLDVTNRTLANGEVEIVLRVRDSDGTFNGGRIDFGDGTDEVFSQAVAKCASPTPGPYRAEPSDRSLRLVHQYPRGGDFRVFIRVRSDRLCQPTPVEETTRTVTVRASAPSPSAAPQPVPTSTPSPTASPEPSPSPTELAAPEGTTGSAEPSPS